MSSSSEFLFGYHTTVILSFTNYLHSDTILLVMQRTVQKKKKDGSMALKKKKKKIRTVQKFTSPTQHTFVLNLFFSVKGHESFDNVLTFKQKID